MTLTHISEPVSQVTAAVRLKLHANWIRATAHEWVNQIDGLKALTPEQRCDLREWPMRLLEQADKLVGDGE